jgi:transcriptional regulator with XRE-family HTH domain
MTDSSASSVQRRRLRDALRRARDAADLTQDQVAASMEWSLSKVIRIESGMVRISVSDLRVLLNLYGIDDPGRVNGLLDLARGARRRSWLAPYKGVLSPAFVTYAELEADANEIRFFNTTIIPGIAQTEAYARAMITELRANRSAEVPPVVDVRLRRQHELFEQDEPPTIIVLLDEAALRRQVGGRAVMADQLRHLARLAERPHVHVLIIPFAAGAHPGIFGPFIIMDLPDPADKPLIYREGPLGDVITRDRVELINSYRQTFDQLTAVALTEADSLAFIRAVADELG